MSPNLTKQLLKLQKTSFPISCNDIYYGQNILMRMVEPERVVSFRVAWIDDQEKFKSIVATAVNEFGYCIQRWLAFSSIC